MFLGALVRPLFWLIVICMTVTASLELGPNRWVPAVLEAGGIPGILVLAYINGLMAVLRFFAGPVVEKLSPTGIMLSAIILTAIGLYWFSFAETTMMAFVSATVFAVGICYMWPTMLGITSERVPRSGAFGLAFVGGIGMLMVGVVTSPRMGQIADHYLHENLDAGATREVLEEVAQKYPVLAADAPETIRSEILGAAGLANSVVEEIGQSGSLPKDRTADALRSALKNAPEGADAITGRIGGEVLGPADNFGGRMAFRYLVPFAALPFLVFLVLFLRDRTAGGYRAETIGENAT
jgi:hypothetical protein